MSPVTRDPHDALAEHFGFDAFRPGQEDAVRGALAGRDVLVVMPTGAGKSLTYQLPALMRDDLTLVVSPLVSLMQDQVQALDRRAPGRVALINAQQEAWENDAIIERATAGEVKVLYVAPERFSAPGFAHAMKRARIGLFVVDEAHCVSQWGHDFRPDYFRLGDAARWLEADAIIASTATATPEVAADIVAKLHLREPVEVATGFDRPNLSFGVVPVAGGGTGKARQIAAVLSEPDATPAIVYAGTRRGVDELSRSLASALGREVVGYHAGLARDARAEAQRRFMDGEVDVVVATNAFGMGVDKADVRTVLHETVPQSLEAYYQEAGRAGRDGRPSRAFLLAAGKDKGLHVFFINRSEVSDGDVSRVATRLFDDAARAGSDRYDVGLGDLGDEVDSSRAIIAALQRAKVVQPAPAPADRVRGRILTAFDASAKGTVRRAARDAQEARWKQYRTIWAFVDGAGCRRQAILDHFGDPAAPAPDPGVPCCDRCDPALVAPLLQAAGGSSRRAGTGAGAGGGGGVAGGLDGAIVATVATAEPSVGRTRVVEILRGGQSKVVLKHAYDGLPAYGTFDHLTAGQVLQRVDELIEEGRLRSTGGAYPKLAVVPGSDGADQAELAVA